MKKVVVQTQKSSLCNGALAKEYRLFLALEPEETKEFKLLMKLNLTVTQ